jgi:hypothetical protein
MYDVHSFASSENGYPFLARKAFFVDGGMRDPAATSSFAFLTDSPRKYFQILKVNIE